MVRLHVQTPPDNSLAVDATRCPLCGQPNGCAMEAARGCGNSCQSPAGTPGEPCWCTREQFAPNLLQRVPAKAQGLACICQACVREAAAS